MIERTLRWTAVVVAVLSFVDPPVTLSGRVRPRVSLMLSGGGTSDSVRRDATRILSSDFEIINGLDRSADAIVVVGNRFPDERIDERAKVSTVTVPESARKTVVIDRVMAPQAIPPATAVRLGVDVAASHSRGSSNDLQVRSGTTQLARRTHSWTGDEDRWHEDIDVIPVGAPPWLFEVSAGGDHVSVAVEAAPRLRVLVIESRPSWSSAFVRRALEDDARFDVSGLSSPSPAKVVTTAASGVLPDDPRAFDAIVLGGLDRTTAATVNVVERFTHDRGGTVVLLPDERIPATIAERLVAGVRAREALIEIPAMLDVPAGPRIRVSEMLEATDLPDGSQILATSPSSKRPVVWSVPAGDGRIVVSGALDAWRYRADVDAGFDRFWRSVISGAALDARPAVDVQVVPGRATAGDRVRVVARVRRMEREQQGDRLAISAQVDGQPLRLWPAARAGEFAGEFVVEPRGEAIKRITASLADGQTGSQLLIVDPVQHGVSAPPLAWLSTTRGGIDVDPASLDRLAHHLRSTLTPASIVTAQHPMRSAWWFVPFAACLSAEWWLRRRRGAR